MSNNSYTIAIIIPTLNEERFIESCIASVRAQSYPFAKMDVMVIDGGSTDRTREIVSALHTEYPNIRLIHNPQRFQSAAFNIGVEASDAPYIVRLDAHATYDTHYIERCIALLSEHPEYGNVGGVCEILPQNNSLTAEAIALLNHLPFGIGGAAFRVATTAQDVDSVPFGAFRREVVQQVGGMLSNLARGEDNEYNARIRNAGFIVRLDPAIRSSYFARATWSAICKQMYLNGVSIGQLYYIDRSAIGLRHLVPLAFVSMLILSAILASFTSVGLYLLAAILISYLFAALIADIQACRSYGRRFFFILPPLFLSVHIAYGLGTIKGLVNRS